VLGILNALVRPILTLLTFPLTILTLGLFLFVINGLTGLAGDGVPPRRPDLGPCGRPS